tara:strand:- start:584 stop:889 length:306 start_codon:yes stop_codon:yes gene_type:complete
MSLNSYEDIKENQFWEEIQELSVSLTHILKKYDMEDRVLSAFMIGVLSEVFEDEQKLKTFFHYSIQDENELQMLQDVMRQTYEDDEPDLDDLLRGTGIFLN